MEKVNLLTFSVGKEYFAINAKHVREVLIHPYCTRLTDDDTQIDSIVNFKGKKLPVINSQKRLNVRSKKSVSGGTIIIFEYHQFSQKHFIAAKVSSIDDILSISTSDIVKKRTRQITQPSFIQGTFRLFERSVRVIDADKFLNMPDLISTNQYINQNCIA